MGWQLIVYSYAVDGLGTIRITGTAIVPFSNLNSWLKTGALGYGAVNDLYRPGYGEE
jgi:hypothetical protein